MNLMPSRRRHVAPWATPIEPGALIYRGGEVKNDASLLDILGRLPGGRADFAHTKPSELMPEDDIAQRFDAFGVQALRASLVDLGSMRCTHAWHITDGGAMVADASENDPDRAFLSAMATIVKLSPAGPEQTHKRELDPLCWAFAWLAEERHVAVVEAQYRVARSDHSDADVALVRQVFDAGLRAALAPALGATPHDDPRPSSSTVNLAQPGDPTVRAARRARVFGALRSASANRPLGIPSWLGLSQRAVLVVLALGLVMAGILFALLHSATSLRADSAQHQAKADATMRQMVGKALAEGDYGEVQAELASFSSLNYFESALVTNARGRVIAAAGPIQGIRMGDPLAAGVAASARVIELDQGPGPNGKLLVWERAASEAFGLGAKWLTASGILIALGIAAVAAVLLLQRQRRGKAGH